MSIGFADCVPPGYVSAVTWDGAGIPFRPSGSAGAGITVPDDAEARPHTVTVTCTQKPQAVGDTTKYPTGSASFTVTPTHEARQDLALSPDRGPSGTTVTVSGIGFNCSAVRVSWDDGSSLVSGLTPDGEGNISGTFAVPKGSSAGKHTVEAVCTDYPTYQATADFTVAEEETTGTTGTTPDGQNNGGTTGGTGDTTGGGGTTGGTGDTTGGGTTGDTDGNSTGDTTNGGTTGDTGDTANGGTTGDTDGAVGSDGGTDSGGVGDTDDGDTAVPVAWVVGPSAFAALLLLALLFSLLSHRHRGVRWVHDHLRTALRSGSGAGTAALRRRRDGGSPDRSVRLEPHADPGDQRLN
ncbi:hypothetical protein [Streptomyces neyagawaensis]|uniref:IPT/TIG domain-containing protein n=1 Tax=Streptomyces neyagawaensis TaxID=42238 RepID=A0ABV3ASG3_9ACTN